MQQNMTLMVRALSPDLLISVGEVLGLGRILIDVRQVSGVARVHLAAHHHDASVRVSVSGDLAPRNPIVGVPPTGDSWIEIPSTAAVAAAIRMPEASVFPDEFVVRAAFRDVSDFRVFTRPWCMVLRAATLSVAKEHANT